MNASNEIDALFDTAGRESEAVAALDGAVAVLKAAREAKARLASLDAPQLRAELLRRSESLGGEPA